MWNTGGIVPGAVYVAAGSNAEALMAIANEGSKDVDWIDPSVSYEWRLYNDVDKKTLLAKVAVTGVR
jgi:hypothetical protein